jgi:hypothetical protein
VRSTPVFLAAAIIGALVGVGVGPHADSRPAVGATAAPAPVPVSVLAQRMEDRENRLDRASRSRIRWVAPKTHHTGLPKRQLRHPHPADSTGTVWDRLAQCESSGNWHEHGGNGFYGGLQFAFRTWRSFKGTQFAWRADYATREEQIIVAKRVLRRQGWAAWPACSRKLGLR